MRPDVSIYAAKCGPAKVVSQDLLVALSGIGHHRGSDLAHPHAVAPPRSQQMKPWDRPGLFPDHEGRAIQMRARQRPAYEQLLADDQGLAAPGHFEPYYPAGATSLERLQIRYCAHIYSHSRTNYVAQLLSIAGGFPAIEVRRLLVETGQDSRKKL